MVARLGAVSSTSRSRCRRRLHDLVGAVAAARPTTWIVGLTGDASADAPVVDACSRWGVTVGGDTDRAGDRDRDDRRFRRRRRDPRRHAPPAGARRPTACAWTAPRSSCRRSSRTPAPSMPCSTAAGLAHNGPPIRRLADSIAGRTLARLIGMVDSTFARDDVMAFLASVPIRRDGGRPVPVDRWDLISRRAGVVDGDDWSTRLARYAADMADARSRPRTELGDARRRRRLRCTLGPGSVAHATRRAGRVRRRAAGPTRRLRRRRRAGATGPSRPGPRCSDALGDARARRRWPEAERDAFDAVLGALDRLAALEAVEDAPAPGAFRARSTPSSPHRSGGSAGSARACCARRSAPRSASTSTPSSSWAWPRGSAPCRGGRTRSSPTATGSSRSTASSRCARPRSRTNGGATSPRSPSGAGHRILSAPRGDLRTGRERLPSRYLLETATALTGDRVFGSDFAEARRRPTGSTRSRRSRPGSATRDGAASVVEHDLGVVDAFAAAGGDPAAHPLVAGTPVATGLEAVARPGVGRAHALGRQRGGGAGPRALAGDRRRRVADAPAGVGRRARSGTCWPACWR